MILRDMLEFAAARYPENLAMVDGDRRYTYAEWDERVSTVANALQSLGVGKGDRVVQVIKNREENCAIHMACQKLGAINTPINFRWASGEIEFCVNDAEARLVVIEEATAERVLSARDEFDSDPRMLFVGPDTPDGVDSFDEAVAAAESSRPSEKIEETDTGLMLYTSGTTGRPKGVPRSQRAEYAATVGHIVEHRYSLGERTLGVMPLFHTMGMHSLTSMLALNGLFVAMPDWDAEHALEIVEREQLTCLYLIPTLFHELVHHEAFERHDTSSVRKLSYAGASMLSALVEDCIEKFEPEVFVNHYGSTEVYIFSTYPKPREKPGCAGRASFHTELRVVRADPEPNVGPDEVVPEGETGEIIVRLSDDAFAGYYNRPEAEDVLDKHADVSEVAVVGLPDEKWGQAVTAFVVPERPEMTEEEIRSYLKEDTNLARFKHPKKVVFVKEIPKSPVGKLLRRLLVEGEYEEVKPPTEDAEVTA